MANIGRQRWLGTAILIAMLYAVVGITSSALAGAAASNRMVEVWRWAAFVVSGAAFAAHIAYEHVRRAG